jgi:hypothetical protein
MDADFIYLFELVCELLLGLFLTALTYMAFPFIYMMINIGKNEGRFEKKRAKKIALWNSIIVGAIFFVLNVISENNSTWSPLPAMLYYWINCAILTDKTKG